MGVNETMELAGWRRRAVGGAAWGGGVSVTVGGSGGGMYGGGAGFSGVNVRYGGGGGGRWGGRGGCGCIGVLGCGCAGRSRCHRWRRSSARVLCDLTSAVREKWALPRCGLGRVRVGPCSRVVAV